MNPNENEMALSEAFRRRYSVRAYKNAPVGEQIVQSALEAAISAPSAGNLQAYEIVVVRNADRRGKLARAALEQAFVAQAPVSLVFFANPERNRWRYKQRGADLYAIQDATLACAYAQLQVTAAGLGTCWVGAFDDDAVRQAVGAPSSWRPVAILPIGEPAEAAPPRERAPLSNILHRETV